MKHVHVEYTYMCMKIRVNMVMNFKLKIIVVSDEMRDRISFYEAFESGKQNVLKIIFQLSRDEVIGEGKRALLSFDSPFFFLMLKERG